MFGKNDEPITASNHMINKKNIYLYRSRNNNQPQIKMATTSTIDTVKSYDTFLSTVKGYKRCSDLSCNYTTYLENNTDKIKTETIDDWYVTTVNYTGLQLDASNNPLEKSEMLGGTNWPYSNTRGGETDCGLKTSLKSMNRGLLASPGLRGTVVLIGCKPLNSYVFFGVSTQQNLTGVQGDGTAQRTCP